MFVASNWRVYYISFHLVIIYWLFSRLPSLPPSAGLVIYIVRVSRKKESAASVSCSFILELTTKSSLAGALSAVCVLCRLSKGTRRKMKLLRMRLYYYLLRLSVGCLLFCPSGLKLRSRERMTNGLTNTPT